MAASRPPCRALIIGATGTIGKYITDAIIGSRSRIGGSGSLAGIAILTSPTTASDPGKQALLSRWTSQGVSVITGDITSAADVSRAYAGIDTVVSALGRNALRQQIELLRLAERSETVRTFFPSEYGTDVEYDDSSRDERPHQAKLEVRAFVREHVRRLRVTYLVTGPYIDMFLQYKPGVEAAGGFDAKAGKAVLVGDGTDRIGFTTMPDVGKFVAAALEYIGPSQSNVLKVQSFVATARDILAEFEKQTGQKFQVDYTPKEKLRELELKYWAESHPAANLFTLRRIWSEGKTLYAKTDNESLGVSDRDLESLSVVVKRAVDGVGY